MTDAQGGSLLQRMARGAGWVIAWRIATRLLGFGSTLILVRLLSPADFGLVAIATAFAAALEVCLALGLEDQIVRAKNPDRALYDTAFTINLIRCCVIGVMVAAAAGPAASFFGDARLEPVLWCLGALAALMGLTNIGVADFRRELRFDREFKYMIVPRLVSIGTTIGCAFFIGGHWALVAGIATGRVTRLAMSYAMHPFRPRLSLAAWRALAGVGFWTWAIGVIAVIKERADTIMVGRQLGPASVGVYAAGQELAVLATTELVDPITRAAFPGFAATMREGNRIAETFLRIVGLTALVGLPMGVGLSLMAQPIVWLAYGPRWIEAAQVVTIIGLVSCVTPVGNISQALLGAQTRLRTIVVIFLLAAILRVTLLLAAVGPFGIAGAAMAVAAAMLIEQALLVGTTLHVLKLRPRLLLGTVWRPMVATAAMAASLHQLGLGWGTTPAGIAEGLQTLITGVGLGVLVYLAVLGLLWIGSGRRPGTAEHDALEVARRILGAMAATRRAA